MFGYMKTIRPNNREPARILNFNQFVSVDLQQQTTDGIIWSIPYWWRHWRIEIRPIGKKTTLHNHNYERTLYYISRFFHRTDNI